HSQDIRYLTDVNVNKLYQPWRSFASVINKCLTGKSSRVDSFRLSQAQMLWGLYHRINIDFAYLIWEDFVYQVEHKSQKRSNEMNYPRFTKVIIDYFMTRKPSILRRNRIHWHYVRDDALFSTVKVVSRHQATQQYGVILPIELTTNEIRNNESAPRLSASAKGKRPLRATTTVEPTDLQRTEAEQLKIALKRRRQKTHISQQQSGSVTGEGTSSKPGVPDVPSDDSEEELSDDKMFTPIKLVSRHQNMQQFGAMLPIELTKADIRKSDAYKEYYAVATRATPPKTKASVLKTKSSSDTTVTPSPTVAAGTRLTMDTTINQQVEIDEAIVPHAHRLRI
nr:hypothetical protein [Tanacetum cinerariifolium]